jgi:hypothetical protein
MNVLGDFFYKQNSQIGTWIKTHIHVSALILFYFVAIYQSVTVLYVSRFFIYFGYHDMNLWNNCFGNPDGSVGQL